MILKDEQDFIFIKVILKMSILNLDFKNLFYLKLKNYSLILHKCVYNANCANIYVTSGYKQRPRFLLKKIMNILQLILRIYS
ncbi:hypothetical protein BBG48_002125 [Criibacterium bergeronii]|uniref:Uncharacterized protein n=1 Tax=Criibacterium bergeronii TaxID=1871336 RepID=A0A371IN41_9FIRM|nr:hypothetical protein BBG48_002125 [Criibacterium bergeronii]